MVNRCAKLIRLQVSFRYVSHMFGTIDQHVIPGLILGWTTFGHLFIPGVRTLKSGIDIHDNATVVKKLVVNQLANRVFAGTFYNELPVTILSGESLTCQRV